MRTTRSIFALLGTSALLGTACFEPLQNGGVDIIGNPSDRVGAMCRFRRGDAASEAFCASEGQSLPPVRVRRIASPGDTLKGPYATGRSGDYMLENDEIAVVIDQVDGGQGVAESGGNIVDAADAKRRVDALGQILTSFGMSTRQAVYETMQAAVEPDGVAWVEAVGRDARDAKLGVRTRYTLAPGTRAVVVTTTLENDGEADVVGLDLGDTVVWGGATNGVGGQAVGFRGQATAPYLFGVGTDVAYALATDGQAFFSKNGASWSNTALVRGATIARGSKITYERLLLVAPRGDTAALATELFFSSGGAPGGVEVELSWEGKAFLRPNENRIELRRIAAPAANVAPFPDPPSLWLSQPAAGALTAELPPGRYAAKLAGTAGTSNEAIVDVLAGKPAKLALTLSPGGLLRAQITEVEPAAWDKARDEQAKAGGAGARRLEGKPSPGKLQVFDAATGAPIVTPAIATATGLLDVALPAGRYRVVASRGPEFSIDETVVEIGKSRDTQIELGLVRVVDTRGYVGCDLHQHSARSLDMPATLEDHLAASVAEGVECAVATERNTVVDAGPIVDKLGLGAYLHAFPGNEITSDASRTPFGHLAVFPLAPDPRDVRGGATRVGNRLAREVMNELHALPGDPVVLVSHPRFGSRGYFDWLSFDPATGTGAPSIYDGRFDGVEVWSGRQAQQRDRVLGDLWGLLRASHPTTPTASAYAHGRTHDEPGYPRTFVAVTDDDPAKLDAASLAAGLKKQRDVVLTNGPFVTMRIGTVRQGGLASLGSRRRAELTVRVERAAWVDATELTLFVGGVVAAVVPLTGTRKTERGALLDEQTFTVVLGKAAPKLPGQATPVTITEDTFALAVVRGTRPLTPVLAGDPAEMLPFAMTAPLWIDADGDGRSLGR